MAEDDAGLARAERPGGVDVLEVPDREHVRPDGPRVEDPPRQGQDADQGEGACPDDRDDGDGQHDDGEGELDVGDAA